MTTIIKHPAPAPAPAHELDVAQHLAESTPEFMAAMSACLHLVETLGQDHPDTTRAMQLAMRLAPPSLKDLMNAKAKELDLLPEAHGYTADGAPVFSLESVAAKLGMSMDEAHEAVQAMLADGEALGLPEVLIDPATVHRKQ